MNRHVKMIPMRLDRLPNPPRIFLLVNGVAGFLVDAVSKATNGGYRLPVESRSCVTATGIFNSPPHFTKTVISTRLLEVFLDVLEKYSHKKEIQ